MAAAYRYAALGMQFAGGILLYMGLGWLVDRWLGTLPAFLIAGTLVGAVLSFLMVYRRVTAAQDEGRKDPAP